MSRSFRHREKRRGITKQKEYEYRMKRNALRIESCDEENALKKS